MYFSCLSFSSASVYFHLFHSHNHHLSPNSPRLMFLFVKCATVNKVYLILSYLSLSYLNIYRVINVPPALWPKRLLFNGNAMNTLNVFCKHRFSQFRLDFFPMDSVDSKTILSEITAWSQLDDKQLSESMITQFITAYIHTYTTKELILAVLVLLMIH